MIKRAIVATDLSQASDIMVENLEFLKEFGVKELLLLQCPDYQEVASEVFPYVATAQAAAIEDQKQVLESLGFKVESRIAPGSAKREINKIAEKEDFPLVVVGSQGHSLIGGAFLGGVAHEVMLRAKRPLLIVRLTIDEDGKLKSIGLSKEGVTNHLLYATDFSPGAKGVVHYLKKILRTENVKKLTLLHVQDRSRIEPYLVERVDEFNVEDTKRLNKLKKEFSTIENLKIDVKLLYGDPHVEIMRELEDSGASMIIMGTQGRGFLRELFVGSVSQYIARKATVPVLLIPYTE
jgi:nucleotide-binding universal stress UspA family protein